MSITDAIYQIGSLAFMRVLPVKKDRFVFMSFEGHYSDSPKCISEGLHKMNPSIEQIWLIKDGYKSQVPEYIKIIDFNSKKALYYRGTAQCIIDNLYGYKAEFINSNISKSKKMFLKLKKSLLKKKDQFVYTTWHGTPLKCMGKDQIGNKQENMIAENITFLLGNKLTLDIMKRLTFEKCDMELIGTPRNDILFNLSKKKIEETKIKLGIPLDKKVILYAPTFRTDNELGIENKNIERSGINQINEIDIMQLTNELKNKFGGEWVLVCRFHYHVEKLIDWHSLEKKHPGMFFNGNLFDDMVNYLICADILLTDASSCMFDFMITKRPCFLFFPDYEIYKNKERGFYLNVEELPFSLSITFDKLIKSIKEFNQTVYLKKLNDLNTLIESVDSRHSTNKVVKYILKKQNLEIMEIDKI